MAFARKPSDSFLVILKQARLGAQALPTDPWLAKLKDLHGEMGSDGLERIPTCEVLEHLEVPMHLRARSSRRLSHLMIELGWRPTRVRSINGYGFASRLRGFARLSGKSRKDHNSISSR